MKPSEVPVAPIRLKVSFANCPVEASLGVLGRKWALLILRNIALFRATRFNEMLRVTPGMTKRVLAMRLNELEREGFIVRSERSLKFTRWALTEKGADVLPVLMTLVQFGAKWHAERVFSDQKVRPLIGIFDSAYIRRVLGPTEPVRTGRAARRPPLAAPVEPAGRPVAAAT